MYTNERGDGDVISFIAHNDASIASFVSPDNATTSRRDIEGEDLRNRKRDIDLGLTMDSTLVEDSNVERNERNVGGGDKTSGLGTEPVTHNLNFTKFPGLSGRNNKIIDGSCATLGLGETSRRHTLVGDTSGSLVKQESIFDDRSDDGVYRNSNVSLNDSGVGCGSFFGGSETGSSAATAADTTSTRVHPAGTTVSQLGLLSTSGLGDAVVGYLHVRVGNIVARDRTVVPATRSLTVWCLIEPLIASADESFVATGNGVSTTSNAGLSGIVTGDGASLGVASFEFRGTANTTSAVGCRDRDASSGSSSSRSTSLGTSGPGTPFSPNAVGWASGSSTGFIFGGRFGASESAVGRRSDDGSAGSTGSRSTGGTAGSPRSPFAPDAVDWATLGVASLSFGGFTRAGISSISGRGSYDSGSRTRSSSTGGTASGPSRPISPNAVNGTPLSVAGFGLACFSSTFSTTVAGMDAYYARGSSCSGSTGSATGRPSSPFAPSAVYGRETVLRVTGLGLGSFSNANGSTVARRSVDRSRGSSRTGSARLTARAPSAPGAPSAVDRATLSVASLGFGAFTDAGVSTVRSRSGNGPHGCSASRTARSTARSPSGPVSPNAVYRGWWRSGAILGVASFGLGALTSTWSTSVGGRGNDTSVGRTSSTSAGGTARSPRGPFSPSAVDGANLSVTRFVFRAFSGVARNSSVAGGCKNHSSGRSGSTSTGRSTVGPRSPGRPNAVDGGRASLSVTGFAARIGTGTSSSVGFRSDDGSGGYSRPGSASGATASPSGPCAPDTVAGADAAVSVTGFCLGWCGSTSSSIAGWNFDESGGSHSTTSTFNSTGSPRSPFSVKTVHRASLGIASLALDSSSGTRGSSIGSRRGDGSGGRSRSRSTGEGTGTPSGPGSPNAVNWASLSITSFALGVGTSACSSVAGRGLIKS